MHVGRRILSWFPRRHIGKRIVQRVLPILRDEEDVNVGAINWEVFQKPLPTWRGKPDLNRFEEMQKDAIEAIEEILNPHKKHPLIKFVAHLAALEPENQPLAPWARDHVVHCVNTYLLGVYILGTIDFPSTAHMRYDPMFGWKLTGPSHDIGYPIEFSQEIVAELLKIVNDSGEKLMPGKPSAANLTAPWPLASVETFPAGLGDLCNGQSGHDLIQHRLDAWGLKIDVLEYYRWLRAKNKTDHGVIGALSVLKVLDAQYQIENPKRQSAEVVNTWVDDEGNEHPLDWNEENFRLDIVSACASVFIHNIDLNYTGFGEKIDFGTAPLAFLLYLCDTFQEWDRYGESRKVYSGRDFDIDCDTNCVDLRVPEQLAKKVVNALSQRLKGLTVTVNEQLAVS